MKKSEFTVLKVIDNLSMDKLLKDNSNNMKRNTGNINSKIWAMRLANTKLSNKYLPQHLKKHSLEISKKYSAQ